MKTDHLHLLNEITEAIKFKERFKFAQIISDISDDFENLFFVTQQGDIILIQKESFEAALERYYDNRNKAAL